mmetsp:Transcript_31279/g.30127  ORF Transcript_31279/g.30127 Transcript_31279/m.30127 type:complete len:502 (-) Transcript_31279:209-1714(-)
MTWRGQACRVFNVGKYRREIANHSSGKDCDANFFDDNNKEGRALRQKSAVVAMTDMLEWLDDQETTTINSQQRVAIFDATNSTVERRQWVLEQCTLRPGKPTGVIFVESVCNDKELLEENFNFKIKHSPDYRDLDKLEAIADLKRRCDNYERQYETIDDDTLSYIKIFNLSSKVMVNHIYGRMAKTIVPCLMSWNIANRSIYICRSGHTQPTTVPGEDQNSDTIRKTNIRSNKLGKSGERFRDALCAFIGQEGLQFNGERTKAAFHHKLSTGTSVTGLMKSIVSRDFTTDGVNLPFPCHIMSSTMPRAVDTAQWDLLPFPVHQFSNLNPLDKGDFSGMELEDIRELDPQWYAQLEADPFRTRFPGGECYGDLITRLESCIIDMEQQVCPVLVVSHVSVIQVLLAYFRRTPVEECTSIEVPMNTVIKFSPVTGGGWVESQENVLPHEEIFFSSTLDSDDEPSKQNGDELASLSKSLPNSQSPTTSKPPIWGDHTRILNTSNH